MNWAGTVPAQKPGSDVWGKRGRAPEAAPPSTDVVESSSPSSPAPPQLTSLHTPLTTLITAPHAAVARLLSSCDLLGSDHIGRPLPANHTRNLAKHVCEKRCRLGIMPSIFHQSQQIFLGFHQLQTKDDENKMSAEQDH